MRAVLAKPLPGLILAVRGRSSGWLFEATILIALATLSYGVFIPWLGYYWDDWRILWVGSSHSPTTLLENYAYRPGTAWLFHALNRFVGTNYPLAHCLALAARVLSALVLWRIIRVVWPSCTTPAFSAAALFLLYPGFTQQSIPLTYQNYHVGMLLCLLSIYASLRSNFYNFLSIGNTIFSCAAVVFQVMYLLVLDGLVAWEAIRWALMLVAAARCSASVREALALAARRAAPYAMTVLGFVLWRGLFVRANREDVDLLVVLRAWRSLSFGQVATLIPGQVLESVLDSALFAWPVQAWRGVDYREKVVLAGAFMAAIGASLAYSRLRRWSADEGPGVWARGFILVGSLSLLAIGLFQCMTRKTGHLEGEADRLVYSAGVAAVFLVLGLSGSLLGKRATVTLVTFLVGLSTLSNFGHAYTFKRLWAAERSLNWQLAWRAPDIEPGTLVVVARPRLGSWLFDNYWAHDINGPLNLHYTDSESPLIGLSLNGITLDLMELLSEGHRNEAIDLLGSHMKGYYGDLPGMRVQEPPGVLLMFLGSPEGTLRVVDPDRVEELPDLDVGSPPMLRSLRPLARYTRIGLIRGSGPVGIPTDRLVGGEPPHTWAWHFQRAELARQFGRRDELIRLMKDVCLKGFTPVDPSEWLIFLEAAIRAGDRKAASWIVLQVRTRHEPFIPTLRTWLARFSTGAEGRERAFAGSLAEDLSDRPGQGGHRDSRPVR